MENLIMITTTSDDREELEKIAAILIQQRLAACCQISGPITSVYSWNGKLEKSDEWTCSIKTVKRRYSEVADAIRQNHHYEEPQVIALDICSASEGYRNWVVDSVIDQ